MQVGNHTEAILDIGFYANITHVVDIGIFPIRLGRIAARTYTACRKGAHTVGTADIELLRIRCGRSVAIRPYHPSGNTRGYHLILVYPVMVPEFRVQLQELCKRYPEKLLSFLTERLAENTVDGRSQVTGRRNGGLPPDGVTLAAHGSVVISIGVLHGRNELVAQTNVECRILGTQRIESGSRIAQYIECQPERSYTVPGSRFGLEVISDITAKSQQLIILGTVHLVGI